MTQIIFPRYLYKESPLISSQISPYARINPVSAVNGQQAFESAFAPNQQLQKKQIYLDYKSFYKLWDSEKRALIIAKLKQQKFSVFFICQKQNQPNEPILAEIDDELELKIDGQKKSIFSLNDQDIQGLSSIDHLSAIDKLSLAKDDSIIMKFDQFKEVGDVLGVNSWVEKGVFKSHLSLSSFKGLEEFVISSHNSFVNKNIHLQSFDQGNFVQMMINYFQLPDFELDDENIKILLNYFESYWSSFPEEYLRNILTNDLFPDQYLRKLLKVIYKDNPETVKKIFDYWFGYQFETKDDDKKILFQKFLIKNFWHFHPDFLELIAKAKSIDEFRESDFDKIAESFIGNVIRTNRHYAKQIDLNRLSEPLRQIIIGHYVDHAKTLLGHPNERFDDAICDLLMIFEKYNKDFEIFVRDKKMFFKIDEDEIEIEKAHIIKLLNNETINKRFSIDRLIEEQLKNLITDDRFRNIKIYQFNNYETQGINFVCNYFDLLSPQNQQDFIQRLQSFIDQALDDSFVLGISILSKILTNPKVSEQLSFEGINCQLLECSGMNFLIYSIFFLEILQHCIEKDNEKKFTEEILIKLNLLPYKPNLSFALTPEFEDFLITLHQEGKIDLKKFRFSNSSSISKKLWSEHSLSEMQNIGSPNNYAEVATDFYLANYAITSKQKFQTQLAEVSSQQLNQSPIQFYLVDLNQKSLDEIRDLILEQKIDPSKILSLNILGFNQVELARKSEVGADSPAIDPNLKQQLLTYVIGLFPNLKHLRVNKVFSEKETKTAIADKKIVREFIDYMPENIRTHLETIATLPSVSNVSENDNTISIANQAGNGKANKSGNPSFTMVEAGKILSRPQTKIHPLLVRDSLSTLKTDCHSLGEDWLPKNNSAEVLQGVLNIPTIEQNQFDTFTPDPASSQDHTFCSFTQDLNSGNNSLLSISPDNEIVGYYVDPEDADISFEKDANGFFYAICDKQCQIKYILKGCELEYQTLKNYSANLPDKVKKIVDDYVGRNGKDQFPIAIQDSDYQLPQYSDDASIDIQQKNKQWLDELFSIANKGACRHRVMAMAYKFQEERLQNGRDFRIVGVNNNHILLEVKNNDDSWITLDLGGSNAQLNYSQSTYKPCQISPYLIQEKPAEVTHPASEIFQIPVSSQDPNFPSSSPRNPQAEVIDNELKIVSDQLDMLYKLQELTDFDQFKQSLTSFVKDREKKSLLLKTNYCEELKNYLLGFSYPNQLGDSSESVESVESSNQAIKAHFIGSSQDMEIAKSTIKIQDQDQKVAISQTTFLSDFIEIAKQNSEKKHFLIIDWQKFDDKSRVAFNTMFDQSSSRSINGVDIPSNVVIICLDDARTPITDPAVLSRFNDAYDLSSVRRDDLVQNNLSLTVPPIREIIEFDCQGEENWQAKLLGRLVVNGQLIEFRQSKFTAELKKNKSEGKDKFNFKFKNFSAKQQSEISILFAQARVQGFIDYFGHKIPFPKNYSLQFDKTEFNFAEILQSFKSSSETAVGEADSGKLNLVIHKNFQPINDDVEIVNSYYFDQLLAMPEIADDKYQEQAGLIERAKNLTLKLFITEQLTPSQLYCLMFNAKKHRVNLELYLGQGVKFDDQVFSKFNKTSATPQAYPLALTPASSPSRITITNDVEQEFNNLKGQLTASANTKDKPINIVNIEDVLFSDLFSKSEFQFKVDDQSEHFTFQQKISEVKTKLDAQEIVVLKGKFPKDLLSLLHPQILNLKQQYPNLYFIIEEQEINSSSQASTQLAWLDRKKYSIKFHPKKELEKITGETERTVSIADKIAEDSPKQALDFIKQRKEKLKELLLRNSALQIIGHSGVGKSSLLHEVKRTGFENAGDVEISEELENFEKWASDTSGKTKILVIDEFNVDGSLNFTMFRDFVNAKNDSDNSRRKIFYKGKFYQLDQNHKVVFLGNPHNYGNRYKHQLFSDCQIQEWQLKDFPVSYIYENILKEPIFDKLGQEIKQQLGDGDNQKALENFKKIAVEAIRKYYENNTKKSDDESDLPQETVRELQERVLQRIARETQKNLSQKVANDNFISTQINQETILQLQTAVKIRQLQKQGDFPRESLGTPGVIFEGDSGVGKSVMIEAVLQNQGIKKISSFEDFVDGAGKHCYYKIDASLSSKEIKEKLIQAFELGVIVVIDELNTRINEGLEKEINSLLTGRHPTKPEIGMQPGFMIITSVNKASSAGRANFSLAIKHRCTNISAPHLKQYQVDDIVEIMVNWAKNDPSIQASSLKLIKTIAQKFQRLAKGDPKFNLRSLRSKFNEIKDRLILHNVQYSQQNQFQKPNLQLMQFPNNTQLKFFSAPSHNLQNQLDSNREKNSNFHFRDKNPQANDAKKNIFQALKETQDQLGISDDDMMQFSILAVKHQGLGNIFVNLGIKQKIEADFQKLFGENCEEKKSQAIEFSAEFQRKLKEKNILTGRRDQFREVGMRLKRLDPELLLEFLLKDHSHSLKREFIKDNFVNKLNKILATNNESLEDSIKTLISQGNQRMGSRRQ